MPMQQQLITWDSAAQAGRFNLPGTDTQTLLAEELARRTVARAKKQSFASLQEKVSQSGVAMLTPEEKHDYVTFLTAPVSRGGRQRFINLLPSPIPDQPSMTYAGVGSRETPAYALEWMTRSAQRLEARGYFLQTGDAAGADTAFANGTTQRRIFTAKDANPISIEIAREIHPAPYALSPFALRLMARNAFQVFGPNLDQPVDFVLVWTPDGCEEHLSRTRATGGTGQAIALASLKGIPVINMQNSGWADRVLRLIGADTELGNYRTLGKCHLARRSLECPELPVAEN